MGWRLLLAAGLVVPPLTHLRAPAGEPKATKSALEADPEGWTDLLAGKDLKHWKRVPIPPGGKLSTKNPWTIDRETGRLICDGVGVHEMLLYEKQFGDGILHVEWRFKKLEGKKGYNSGVYVRNSADGKVWHQAQVGSKNVGYLFGQTLQGGKLVRFRSKQKPGPQRGKEAGEWNTYEVTCRGGTLTLWVNGAVTTEWDDCQLLLGFVGLEAEGYWIEFRNVKFKQLK
jgi:hypothetical protein